MKNDPMIIIQRIAAIFSSKMGQKSLPKLFPVNLTDDKLKKLPNKNDQIIYLLITYLYNEDFGGFKSILQTIIDNHRDYPSKDYELDEFNELLLNFNLKLDSKTRRLTGIGDLNQVLTKIITELPSELVQKILPKDIRDKGDEMSKVYSYLYCVENALRLFIHQVCKEKYGDDYINTININTTIRGKIDDRKEKEEKQTWMAVKSDIDLFYVDFKDLGNIIQNNQELLDYFPSREWITQKIDEMAECRNKIAHNSFIGQTEREVIKLFFNQILSQIQQKSKTNSGLK